MAKLKNPLQSMTDDEVRDCWRSGVMMIVDCQFGGHLDEGDHPCGCEDINRTLDAIAVEMACRGMVPCIA